jgi:hypothetical protein
MLPIYQSVHQSIDSIEIELTQLSIVAFYLKLRKPLLLITTVCMEEKKKETKRGCGSHQVFFERFSDLC